MALNLKPLGDRVIVEPIEKDEESFVAEHLPFEPQLIWMRGGK